MNRYETGARAQVSRRTLLTGAGKGVGALGAGLLLAQSGLLSPAAANAAHALTRGATQETEQVQDVLDILATNEAFGVTLIGTVLDSARNGAYSPAIPAKVLKVLGGCGPRSSSTSTSSRPPARGCGRRPSTSWTPSS